MLGEDSKPSFFTGIGSVKGVGLTRRLQYGVVPEGRSGNKSRRCEIAVNNDSFFSEMKILCQEPLTPVNATDPAPAPAPAPALMIVHQPIHIHYSFLFVFFGLILKTILLLKFF